MISDEEAYEALAMLEEMKHGLECHVRAVNEHVDTRVRTPDESTHQHFAVIQQETHLSRRLEDLKLRLDQEQLLYSLLTLPPEGIDLLRELLKQE